MEHRISAGVIVENDSKILLDVAVERLRAARGIESAAATKRKAARAPVGRLYATWALALLTRLGTFPGGSRMRELHATFVFLLFLAVPFAAYATASFISVGDVVATVSGIGGINRCDVTYRDQSYTVTGDHGVQVPDNGGATATATLTGNASCVSSGSQITVNFGDMTGSTTSHYLPNDYSNFAAANPVQAIQLGTYFVPGGTTVSLDVAAALASSYSLDPIADYLHEQTAWNSFVVRIYDFRWSFVCFADYESPSRRGFYEETLAPNPDVQRVQLSDSCTVPVDRQLNLVMDSWVSSSTGNYHRTPEPSSLALVSLAMLAIPAIRRRKPDSDTD